MGFNTRDMKRMSGLFAAVLIVVTLNACGDAETQSVDAAEELPEMHFVCNGINPEPSVLSQAQIFFGEEIERLSEGRFTQENHFLSIYEAGEEPEALGGGLADCGTMNPLFPELYPIFANGLLPFLLTDTIAGDIVNVPGVGDIIRDELGTTNIVPLVGTSSPQAWFFTEELENGIAAEPGVTFEGLRIRGHSRYPDVIELLGGEAVSMVPSEVPIALRQGILDGFITSPISWKDLGVEHDAPYAYTMGLSALALFSMNKDTYDSLTDAGREIIHEAAINTAEKATRDSIDGVETLLQEAGADPQIHIIEATDAELAGWRELVQPIWDEFRSLSPEHEEWVSTLSRLTEEGYTPSWEQ